MNDVYLYSQPLEPSTTSWFVKKSRVALLATSWNPNPSLPGTIGEAWERCRAVRHDEDCVIGVRCDITNGGEVDYALNQITKKWGRIVSFFQLSYCTGN